MARAIKRKTTKPKRIAKSAKARSKRSTGRAARRAPVRKPAAASVPIISRGVVEEIVVHSAKSPESEQLSDQALSQIAMAASLDPAKLLEAHRRLRDEADEANVATVFQIVELWNPFA